MIDATAADDESVVGDECHLVSGRVKGPRHDPTFPLERLDEPDNLMLLVTGRDLAAVIGDAMAFELVLRVLRPTNSEVIGVGPEQADAANEPSREPEVAVPGSASEAHSSPDTT